MTSEHIPAPKPKAKKPAKIKTTEVDVDSYKFDHTCPKCGFPFSSSKR